MNFEGLVKVHSTLEFPHVYLFVSFEISKYPHIHKWIPLVTYWMNDVGCDCSRHL